METSNPSGWLPWIQSLASLAGGLIGSVAGHRLTWNRERKHKAADIQLKALHELQDALPKLVKDAQEGCKAIAGGQTSYGPYEDSLDNVTKLQSRVSDKRTRDMVDQIVAYSIGNYRCTDHKNFSDTSIPMHNLLRDLNRTIGENIRSLYPA